MPKEEKSDKHGASFEKYATVEAICDGVPVYSFDNILFVYSQGPDLLPGLVMQEGNPNPIVKFAPKKSWEIKHNLCGFEHEMAPSSPWNDSQAMQPIHLIDGDKETAWSSWGCPVPDGWPEWIRIDLPAETEVSSVTLICSTKESFNNYGRSLPKEIEVCVSRDAWHWETVYENRDFLADGEGDKAIEFAPRVAKMVWIKANNLTKWEGSGYVFSLGEVEVKDTKGNNLALVSRGAGVTVSSTSYAATLSSCDHRVQNALWAPTLFDLGSKWVRTGPDNGSLTWSFIEHERGKLKVDPKADQMMTEVAENGVNIILVLDIKGNWIYKDPPSRTNWREDRFRELNGNYQEVEGYGPGLVCQNEEMFAAYLRWVEYMVRHFKDRVAYFEIGNEWNYRVRGAYENLPPAEYMQEIFEPTYRVIKQADPEARIMLGNIAYFSHYNAKQNILECLGDGWGPKIDAVGWHPMENPDSAYAQSVRQFKEECKALGFTGSFFATEIYARATYPPGPVVSGTEMPMGTEMSMAKYIVRSITLHSALDMESGACHPFFLGGPAGLSLTRWTWPVQTVVPGQPSVSYYMYRNLATALDDSHPTEFPFQINAAQQLISFAFQRSDGAQVIAAWIDFFPPEGDADAWHNVPGGDGIVETKAEVILPGRQACEATVIDIMNGTEQELVVNTQGEAAILKDMLIKDYPTFIVLK